MKIRIDFPISAQFEMPDPGNNSRELRTSFLQNYLANSGMEIGQDVYELVVDNFRGDEGGGEYWTVRSGRR